jgi:lipoprotein LprG
MLNRSLAALLTIVLLITACSGGDDKPQPADQDPQAILEQASTALAGAKSFHFHLTHENGATPMPLNLQLTEAEGDVAVPDKVAADVKAKAASITASVKVIGIGDRTWITNPFNRQWQELPNTSVRDIANPAALVKSVIADVQDAKLEGQGELDGVKTYQISGTIDSAALDAALPNVEAGLPVTVQVWVGVDDSLPRRARVIGRLSQDEPENIVRQIDLSKFNAAVTITQPQT